MKQFYIEISGKIIINTNKIECQHISFLDKTTTIIIINK